MQGLVGILGGMGPLATVDFFQKVVEETPANRDQDHIPVLIHSVPSIPSRVDAILRGTQSPLPHMLEGLRRLQEARSECIVIPCNTAHYWYADLAQQSEVPVLHIVDAVWHDLSQRDVLPQRIGLLSTEATLAARIYHDRLEQHGMQFLVNSDEERDQLVTRAIVLVKQGKAASAGRLLEQAIHQLRDRGAEACILACTELPVALQAIGSPLLNHCIDPTRSLARAAVTWSTDRQLQLAASSAHNTPEDELCIFEATI